ncbi:10765_t:CDS:2 [Entrophospora sp. SA101]|nr:10765_t:CDS:2 [Entrophospora sp. SA101]CAJ0826391.1 8076_t:CDS:2 [Entrophospora sp. SA101]CAJ0874521.1 17186_t:CDS:2 [Entrophospora sp. SA101]
MDPFEVRLEFISHLKSLNASQPYIKKCVKYAIQNKGCYEDLYRCILEVMDQSTILPRLNLLYFIDALLESSKSINFKGYIELIKQDLNKLILDVTSGPNGIINVSNTRRILLSWKKKRYFDKKNDILKRMEDDRERSKHVREEIWQIDYSIPDFEAEKLWEFTSDLDDDDFEWMRIQNKKYFPCYTWKKNFGLKDFEKQD